MWLRQNLIQAAASVLIVCVFYFIFYLFCVCIILNSCVVLYQKKKQTSVIYNENWVNLFVHVQN